MPGPSMPGSSRVDTSPAINREMFFQNNMMYRHSILRVNYTTYDVRRAQDTINHRTNHCDIMLLSATGDNPTAHPYRYARVLGIYHVNLIYNEPTVQCYQVRRMEFLWVRYFELIHDGMSYGFIQLITLMPLGLWIRDRSCEAVTSYRGFFPESVLQVS